MEPPRELSEESDEISNSHRDSISRISDLKKKSNLSYVNFQPSLSQSISRRITLNVGGVIYQTSTATLCSDPDSMLTTMFSGQWGIVEEDGVIFMDRDGQYFKHILHYLRNRIIPVPTTKFEGISLIQEARFFGLTEMVQRLENFCSENFFNVWSWDENKLEIDNLERWKVVIVDVKGFCVRWIHGRKSALSQSNNIFAWAPEVRGKETVKDDYPYMIKILDMEREEAGFEFGMMTLGPGCHVTSYTHQFTVNVGDEIGFLISEGIIFYSQNGEFIHEEILKNNPIKYYPTVAASCATTVKIIPSLHHV